MKSKIYEGKRDRDELLYVSGVVTCKDLRCGRMGNSGSVLRDGAHVWFWSAAGRGDGQRSHR